MALGAGAYTRVQSRPYSLRSSGSRVRKSAGKSRSMRVSRADKAGESAFVMGCSRTYADPSDDQLGTAARARLGDLATGRVDQPRVVAVVALIDAHQRQEEADDQRSRQQTHGAEHRQAPEQREE